MIWTQYVAIECNGCHGRYYVDTGDPNDCTLPDVGAVKCPWCGAIEQCGEESEFEDDDGEEVYADVGKKSLPECPPRKAKA